MLSSEVYGIPTRCPLDVRSTPVQRLFVCLHVFMFYSRIFDSYGDVTEDYEQGGIFIVSHLLCHGASVFAVSSEGPPWFCSFSGQARGILRTLGYSYLHTHGTMYIYIRCTTFAETTELIQLEKRTDLGNRKSY